MSGLNLPDSKRLLNPRHAPVVLGNVHPAGEVVDAWAKKLLELLKKLRRPMRFEGIKGSYIFDPSDWRKVATYGGKKIHLDYFSDIGDMEPLFLYVLRDCDNRELFFARFKDRRKRGESSKRGEGKESSSNI